MWVTGNTDNRQLGNLIVMRWTTFQYKPSEQAWITGYRHGTRIGVRDGGAAAPPIRAVCRHEFGQRGDIIRAKHNTCLKNTNLGSVTAVNGIKNRIYCS